MTFCPKAALAQLCALGRQRLGKDALDKNLDRGGVQLASVIWEVIEAAVA